MIISIILSTLSVGIVILIYRKSFKKTLVAIAKRELKKWRGIRELSQQMSQTLISYWKSVGLNFTEAQMQNASVHSTYPWSSAFISHLFDEAGAKDAFPYSSAHAGYFQVAKKNRDNPNAPLRGFRITEYAPKVGDLVVNTRQNGAGYDTPGFFASHGEVVVEVGQGYIKTIGGNVQDAVIERTFKTNSKGLLEGNRVSFFMVIQNNIR